MQILTRMSMSADGYVTTPGGWPALTADPSFVSGQSHGIREFLEGTEAALMGRVTFEPALNNDRWPWPNLDVFVLCSERPPGTPDHVVTDSDPSRLLERMRAANRDGDVHQSSRELPGGSVELRYGRRAATRASCRVARPPGRRPLSGATISRDASSRTPGETVTLATGRRPRADAEAADGRKRRRWPTAMTPVRR